MSSIQNSKKPCKVLFVLGSMDIGGVQSGIMNFAKITPQEDAIFDVLVHTDYVGFHEKEFAEYGNVYHIGIHQGRSKIGKLFWSMLDDYIFKKKFTEFLKRHSEYDVVHSKTLSLSAAAVEAAKKCNIPIRIAQSHVDKPEAMNAFSALQYSYNAKRIEKAATHKLAVSLKAIDLMFGRYAGRVIKNPTISLKRLNPLIYNPKSHEGMHIIQVGTYSRRKNQLFSVRILDSLIQQGEKAKLTFVGYSLDEPEYIDEVKKLVEALNLEREVSFLPADSDIPKLLSESDYMLVPSIREGLPNVALEAQAMGVPVFISDTVYRETDCGLCTFLRLESGYEQWANSIITYKNKNGTEKKYIDMSSWDNENVIQEYVKIWRGQ